MTDLKRFRVPAPVIALLSAMIIACASDDSGDYYYYDDSSSCSSCSYSCSNSCNYSDNSSDTYTPPTYTYGPSLPSYIPEQDKSKPPEVAKTADVSMQYGAPGAPSSSTFWADLETKWSTSSYRGTTERFVETGYSMHGTTGTLIAESRTQYWGDGSSTRYAHGFAIVTLDSSKQYATGDLLVSTDEPYLLVYGYMRDGNWHGPVWFNYLDLAQAGTTGSKCQMMAEYQNGQANGECRWFSREGYLTHQGWYANGQRTGTMTAWSDSGTTTWYYQNDTVYGDYRNWDEYGRLNLRGQKYGDARYGKWEFWWPDSDTRYGVGYMNLTTTQGWVSFYKADGKLDYQVWRENDVDEGPYVRWAPEGHILWTGQRTMDRHHGLFKRYTAEGWNDYDTYYEYGVQTGPLNWYYQSGKVSGKGQMVAGEYEGRFTWYREDGTVSGVSDYKDNNYHGAVIEYDTAGIETRHDIYEDGSFIRSELAPGWPEPSQVYDEFGNEVARAYGRWKVHAQKDAPGAITGTAMAWHGGLGGCVLFGGRSGSVFGQRVYGETWLRKNGKWELLFKKDGPPERENAAMAYDSKRDAVVLFGGNDKEGKLFADTWELTTSGWRQLTASTAPAARTGGRMAYDSARGVCVLFGGKGAEDSWGFSEIMNATEEWDGANWRKVEGLTPPPGVYGHAMAYDEERKVTVVHGGSGYKGASGDTWVYDGKRWSQPGIYGADSNWQHGMAYDTQGRRILLVTNGHDERAQPGLLVLQPASYWGIASWSTTGRSHMTNRSGYSVAYDQAGHELVVWGGTSSTDSGDKPCRETLTLSDQTADDRAADTADFVSQDLAAPGWNWLDNGEFNGDPTQFASIVRDEARGVVVYFGGWNEGGYQSQTREFKDGKWELMQPKDSPSARSHAMCWFDETRKSVMLMGGYTDANRDGTSEKLTDLWEWNGKNWKRLRESFADTPYLVHSWCYDSKRGVLVAFASAAEGEARALYEFNGTAWKRTEAGEPASGISGGYWVYDPAAGKVMLYCAYDAASYAPDPRCWYWDGKYWEDAAIDGAVQWGGLNYLLYPDHAGKALWQATPDGLRRLKDGQWRMWRGPAALSFWTGKLWTDERGHVFFHGTNYDFVVYRNDTLEFDPEAGKPLE